VNQLQTRGIVLSRTDYGEADRIVTMLTPDHGKLRLMARGVRKPRSKLAGGIELFSVSDLGFIRGRGEIGTLISARLLTHYGQIVKDIERVQLGYELIKILNKATEDQPEPEYFELLQQAFQALEDHNVDQTLIRLWFDAQLLRQAGHRPNLQTTPAGDKLQPSQTYNFDFDDVSFAPSPEGRFATDDIKFLRLLFSGNPPKVLGKIENAASFTQTSLPLVQTMLQTYIRV
jgi:DNA repair protein RecO (recombination protein O)